MWWRLGLLGAVTAGILYVLLRPTYAFKATAGLSPSNDSPTRQLEIDAAHAAHTNLIAQVMVILGVVAIATWIAWLIVRRYRSRV